MIRHFTLYLVLFFVAALTNSSFSQETNLLTVTKNRHHLFLTNGQHEYQLEDLEIGKEYMIQFTDIAYADACLPSVNGRAMRQIHQTGFLKTFRFTANKSAVDLNLGLDCLPNDMVTKEFMVTIYCETCLPKSKVRSQMGIQVDQNDDAEYLIKDVFLGGNCFDVDNITQTGRSSQFGEFSGATLGTGQVSYGLFSADVDLLDGQEGIILSTGNATDAEGPNNRTDTGEGVNLGKRDADLSKLIGTSSMHDVVALEFDFTPTTEEVSFEYVFASEEYCEYVGSQFNDCLLYTSPSPRDATLSRMPSSA